jgi:FtsP/CotA-like multicopper oxidase with cupredoxin domain
MDAPKSTPGVVGASMVILGAGAAGGALLGDRLAKSSGDQLTQNMLTIEGAIFGTLLAGFAGVVLGAASSKWRPVGETTAIMGIGAPLVMAAMGFAKQANAAQSSQIAQSSGQTYTVTQANSGQTITVNVGDSLAINLVQGMPQPASSVAGVLVYNGSSNITISGSTLVSYQYTAATSGTTKLTSTETPTGQSAPSTFTLTVVVQ